MTRTLVAVLIAVVGCGGDSNGISVEQQGEFAFYDIYGVLGTMQQRALGTPAVAEQIAYSGPCTNGGTVAMQGSYDGDGTTNAVFTLDTTLVGCVEEMSTLDGALHWNGTVAPPLYTQTLTGSLAYVGAVFAGDFTFDITITFDESTQAVTFSGTYKIGGVTYTTDNWMSAS